MDKLKTVGQEGFAVTMSVYATRLIVMASLGFMLLIAGSLFGQPVQAEGVQLDDEPVVIEATNPQTSDDANSEAELPENFNYVAEECNNLTLLVRKSIQIYDAENENLKLSEAAIVYAETNIAQKMGSIQLDIGDKVSISQELVAQFALSSQALSLETLAAWDAYTSNVNFELSDISPVNIEIAKDNTIVDDNNNLTDQSPLTDLGAAGDDGGASSLWWFVGIGAILLLWYVLWRRQDEETS